MLTYSFDEKKNESLYEYLYECIKQDIILGILKPDEKLPSKRSFADNHGISIVTVENAYGQLMAEGYIYSKPKSGFYVSTIDSQIHSEGNYRIERVKEDRITKKDEISLISNHTVAENFPFSSWAKTVRTVLTEQNTKLMITPPAGGVMELREAIAKHLYDFRGIVCNPEQIIIGAGSEYLYGLIVQLLGRDRVYGLENPSSKKIFKIYEALGVKVLPMRMDKEGIKIPIGSENVPDIVQISPSHHFPTGIITPISRRYSLLQWANQSSDRYIIEDDYDSEFRLKGKPIPAMFAMDNTDKVIYFNTFSKSLSSTIRISYMVLPESLLKKYYEKLGFYACTVSNFEQYTLAAFIKSKHFEKHINRMRNNYRELRNQLIEKMKRSKIADSIIIMEEDSGLHFLLQIHTDKDDIILKQRAKEEGIDVSFLYEYTIPDSDKIMKEYNHKAVINYSGLRSEDIDKVVSKLETAWSD